LISIELAIENNASVYKDTKLHLNLSQA